MSEIETIRAALAQGERAMIELGWTMRDVSWRDTLVAFADRLETAHERIEEIAGIIASAAQAETVNGHVLCTPGALNSWAEALRGALAEDTPSGVRP